MVADFLIALTADWLVVPIILVAGIVMLRLPSAGRLQKIARGGIVGLTALLFAKTFSLFYQGQRPFEAHGDVPNATYLPNPGFPSDHALLVFTATIVVWVSTKNVKLSVVLLILSILVAAGRVMALVHTPLDVMGGALCAILAAAVWYGRDIFRRQK